MLNPDSLDFIERLFESYCESPESVDTSWHFFFEALTNEENHIRKQERVDQLIHAFRARGHRIADLDPLGRRPVSFPELEFTHYGLTEKDLETTFAATTLGKSRMSLREVLELLHSTYCQAIGVQYMHIDEPEPKLWLQQKMENTCVKKALFKRTQIRILEKLVDATIFEEFLSKKYVGTKRFGLEGAESLIPLLDLALEKAGKSDVDDIVIGMAHRGRLNVMANIMGKSPALVFREFEDIEPHNNFGRGDVKYHLGLDSTRITESGKKLHLTLCFNPSHLEFVGPVVLGRVRSRQNRLPTDRRGSVMGVIIHGDAAISGQGVVQEMFNMSELPGFRTEGTLHIVLNNQIGFTTEPRELRSSHYCASVAKMLQIPIFHVNGEDPEAVAQAVWLALEYRQTFGKDVVIDMYCYRGYGHNEGDDPTVTQPLLYRLIRSKPSVKDSYLKKLLSYGKITEEEVQELVEERRSLLEAELEKARDPRFDYLAAREKETRRGLWSNYRGGVDASVPDVKTAITKEKAQDYLRHLALTPEGFTCHPKVAEYVLKRRQDVALGIKPLDWGTAENLTYASLLAEGTPVRLTGQDVERGTFSHRHAVLWDFQTEQRFIPLNSISNSQAEFQVWNSPLTETAVLGYEFGLCLDSPDALFLWEAQFGDFANVAQVVFDQFITTSEDKWNVLNHLVVLLPHGLEGQGPEHSSARLERFLQMAAEDNIQVVNLTTPAQFFHCLRRHIRRPIRKPLIIMSPKSLLRHPKCVSNLEEISRGRFLRVIPDKVQIELDKIKRVLLCSGKFFYDLDTYRQENGRHDVAIVRLEQLYPFPFESLKAALSAYSKETSVIWVQEEPENMGALSYLRIQASKSVLDRFPFSVVSRPESSSPATGSATAHEIEQRKLVERAFI